MKKILTALLFASILIGCKIEPPVPETPTGARIRHKTGKIVSTYEVIGGFDEYDNSAVGVKGESLVFKDFVQHKKDSILLFDPLIDSQGNMYHRGLSSGNCRIFKNNVPLAQYNRHPEITNFSANPSQFQMFLVYDQLYITAVYDSQLSFCVDGEWYPIETDEGPIDSLDSKPWVDNDTIYFLKYVMKVGGTAVCDIVKFPIINGKPQKGIMANNEFTISGLTDVGMKTTKRIMVQNGNVLVFVGELLYPQPTMWYNPNNWTLYVNGKGVCNNVKDSSFGGMGVIGNDVYYCVQDYFKKTATIYKNNILLESLQNVYYVVRSISCGDDLYFIIFRVDENGTKYKDVWHNGVIENYPYHFVGALPNHRSYCYFFIPQISYETYVEE